MAVEYVEGVYHHFDGGLLYSEASHDRCSWRLNHLMKWSTQVSLSRALCGTPAEKQATLPE